MLQGQVAPMPITPNRTQVATTASISFPLSRNCGQMSIPNMFKFYLQMEMEQIGEAFLMHPDAPGVGMKSG
jgi:hypothetical protein